MKYSIALVVFFIFAFNVFADEVWESVAGIGDSLIKDVSVGKYNKGIIYACSEKKLYRSEDSGETWRVVFSARGDANTINFVNVSVQGVFVCTEKGVFRSSDGRSAWKRIFKGVGVEENSALHIVCSEKGIMYLGTKAGLFLSSDNGATWKKDHGEAGNLSVKWVAFLGEEVFLASEKGVYRGSSGNWKRVFVTTTENAVYDVDSTDEDTSAVKPVNSIAIDDGELFLATDEGVFVSSDKGNTWQRFTSNGLLSQKVNRLLFRDNLYVATDEGVFVFSEEGKLWRALYKGMAADKAQSMVADNKGIIWVATNKGVHKAVLDSSAFGGLHSNNIDILRANPSTSLGINSMSREEKDILRQFEYEPNIREVQNAAIEYAEVHPNKIKEWRDSARKKALLPDVSIGLDRYVTDLYHWDAGQNPDTLQRGDDVVTWDITMNWNLSELIWNDDQTGIDTRSRLMVQLRDDILDEITRTYFERRRLQIEAYLAPPSDIKQRLEKELRIQELTADLDALTGGCFSEQSR